jgi:hypothetical protein
LRTSLDAVKEYGVKPLGWAVPVDFLYTRFSDEASNRGLLLRETKDRIDLLRAQPGDGPLKARILMVVYLLSRIAGDASYHGVTARTDTIADLLVEDLSNAASLRSKIAPALVELEKEGAIIEVSGEWRLQTKESAEWQQDYAAARSAEANDAHGQGRTRASLLQRAIEAALAGAVQVQQGVSKTNRKIERLIGDEKEKEGGLVLRIWNGWDHMLASTEREIAAAPITDATLHMVIAPLREAELRDALITIRSADVVL